MGKGTLSIHSENILPIIKKWLYSEKDIFIRELISNACDAIDKRKLLQPDGSFEPRIDVIIHKDRKAITIKDTGLGMSLEEVEKYIAQIAFSGAEEFAKQYETQNSLIGHFGLGFYSAYMVASNVEILTLSYVEKAQAVHWSCDGSSDYLIEHSEKPEVGTEITLHINEENEEYLEENKLKELLNRFCKFLPFPIYLNQERINHNDPLWLKNPSECSEKDYLAFYRELYPLEPDPVFWVHLNVDYPFHLKGILYFPKIHKRFDASQSAIKLFCNRVFVSDNCKDLFADYLTVMRGAIDSPDIPLNVSRSYLQMDSTVRKVSTHIAKKITDRLSSLYKEDQDQFIATYKDVETILKLGILQDERFYERSKSFLLWETTNNQWITVEQYLEKNSKEKIYYTVDASSPLLSLYKQDVLIAHSNLDSALINFLESKLSNTQFIRIDSEVDPSLIDASKEKSILDADGKSLASKIAGFFQKEINEKDLDVEAKSLANDTVPAMILTDEKTRRMKEYMSMTGSDQLIPIKQTFVINTNHPLVNTIWNLKEKNSKLCEKLIKHLYHVTLLSQSEHPTKKLNEFLSKDLDLLQELLSIKESV